MEDIFAIAVPVLPGKTDQWKQMVSEMNSRWKDVLMRSRQNLKVRERAFLQHLPQGDVVIVTFTGKNPKEAFLKLGAEDSEFNLWFKQQVKEIHGFDLDAAAEMELPKLLSDSEGRQQLDKA